MIDHEITEHIHGPKRDDDDTPMTPEEIRQNLAEMYRLAYELGIPVP